MLIKLLFIITDFISPLVLGYYAKKHKWLSEAACNKIIEINLVFFATVLSVLSFWTLPLNFTLLWLPLFGILLSVIPGVIAYFIGRFHDDLDKASYLGAAMLSNIGTIGGLCAFFVYGESAYAYIQIIAMFQNLVFFLFCFPMAQFYSLRAQSGKEMPKISWRALFLDRKQLPVVGLVVGMLLYLGGIPRPDFLGGLFNGFIHIAAWTSLIPAGYSIRFFAMKPYYRRTANLIPVKFLATPIISFLIAGLIFHDPVILGSILIAAATPTGINAIILSRLFHLNIPISSAAFLATTLLFMVVVYPLLIIYLHIWG